MRNFPSNYIPTSVFVLFAAKLLILSGNWVDASLLAISAAYAFGSKIQEKNKEINELRDKLNLQTVAIEDNAKQIEVLKTHVAGLKIGQNLRMTQNGRG